MYIKNWSIKYKFSYLKKIFANKFLLFWVFLGLIILQIISVAIFKNELFFWEQTNLLIRKHTLGISLQLAFWTNYTYQFLTNLEKLIIKLDSFIPLFPSNFKMNFWSNQQLYVVLNLPLLFLMSVVIIFLKKYLTKDTLLRTFLIILLIFYFIPVSTIALKAWDSFIEKTSFSIITPLSKPFVWIWDWETEFDVPYTQFIYNWVQGDNIGEAEINVSCLGHYQLFVNDIYVYNGPNFASPPKIYYDKLKINQFIKSGDNNIKIICNFIREPVHEYNQYPRPALLVGGFIEDGLFKRNLADNRLWRAGQDEKHKNGVKISSDTGYSEITDLTIPSGFLKISEKLELSNYQVSERPIKLLKLLPIKPKLIKPDLFDQAALRVGYLQIDSDFKAPCTLKILWGVRLEGEILKSFTLQEDQIVLPAGKNTWNQFSRRAGRYIQIEKLNCHENFNLTFNVVGADIDLSKSLPLAMALDLQIYEISLNTLKNNVQDNFEDSVDRERASYVGDAVSISQCLIAVGDNSFLIKEVIQKYADAQNPDGSFNAMEPSGKKILIPGYSLLWADLLSIYLNETGDKQFAKKMSPHYKQLLDWVAINSSPEGFIKNLDQKEWWSFVDWYPVYEGEYNTPLQLMYLRALETGSQLSKLLGEKDIYYSQALELRNNIYQYAYLKEESVFADGFSLKTKNTPGLITNSIAGKYGYFPTREESKKGIDYFYPDIFTKSPYSQTWVIEWLIKNNQKELALSAIRKYWGGMVGDGATSIYETYQIGDQGSRASYSHAWGCGPIHLYKSIFPRSGSL